MFFRRKAKKTSFSMEELKYSKVPILILDKFWHDMFPAEKKTKQILALEAKLSSAIKEQGQATNDRKTYIKIKKDIMKEILELTTEAYDNENTEAKEKMVKNQQYILEINEKIEEITERLRQLPEEIQKANGELFEESMKLSYGTMKNKEAEIKKLDKKIQELRKELNQSLEQKVTYEEEVEKLYSYLHHMIGADFVEKLDQKFWGDSL
ncbi:MAG: DUF342 domain-containing protein [Epulopiscium sp.]|nr:DUF342 domain-containing protein [Candidatus Epulonipiscium sp.]